MDDQVAHSIIISGQESVSYEVCRGDIIRRTDLETTHEEADTIIIQQVNF